MKAASLIVLMSFSASSFATSLSVRGEAGVNQNSSVLACAFKENDKHEIRMQEMKCQKFYLNDVHALDAGLYLVGFNDILSVQAIAENEDKVIDLLPMAIPKINGAKYFQIFRDLTAREEQEKSALLAWGRPMTQKVLDQSRYKGVEEFRSLWESECSSRPEKDKTCVFLEYNEAEICAGAVSAEAKAYCSARLSDDYRNQIDKVFSPGRDGSLNQLSISFSYEYKKKKATEVAGKTEWINQGRQRIAAKASIDWGVISVLPGTYGIEYTDDTNATLYKNGIVVH